MGHKDKSMMCIPYILQYAEDTEESLTVKKSSLALFSLSGCRVALKALVTQSASQYKILLNTKLCSNSMKGF